MMNDSSPPRRLGLRDGIGWLGAAAELLYAGFSSLIGVVALWLLVSMLAALIPAVGQLLLIVFTPLLTAGLIEAFDQVGRGRRPRPMVLFAGWADPVKRTQLLVLGLWTLLGSLLAAAILVGSITAQVGAERLQQATANPEALMDLLGGVSFGAALWMSAIVFTVLLSSLYFAIPAIQFERCRAGRALAFSLAACLRHWLALLGFALALLALGLALALIWSVLSGVTALVLGALAAMVAQVLLVVITIFVQTLTTGAQYIAYRQVRGGPDANDEGQQPADDQLMA